MWKSSFLYFTCSDYFVASMKMKKTEMEVLKVMFFTVLLIKFTPSSVLISLSLFSWLESWLLKNCYVLCHHYQHWHWNNCELFSLMGQDHAHFRSIVCGGVTISNPSIESMVKWGILTTLNTSPNLELIKIEDRIYILCKIFIYQITNLSYEKQKINKWINSDATI